MTEIEELNKEDGRRIEHYNPVSVNVSDLTETTGVFALAVLALILLVALLRAQSRIRELQQELYQGATELVEGDSITLGVK